MLSYFYNLSLLAQLVVVYLIVINIITFFYFAVDKSKAITQSRRISERKLWVLSLFGGSIGALLGMKIFRHKTKKPSFQAVLAIILVIHVFIVYLLMK